MRFRFFLFFLLIPVVGFSQLVLNLTLEQLTGLSEKIFEGECTSIVEKENHEGRPVNEITFEVSQTLKGTSKTKESFQQIRAIKDSKNGVDTTGLLNELPSYEVGKTYVVFLSSQGKTSGLTSPIGLQQGLFEVKSHPGEKTVVNGRDNTDLFIGNQKSPRLKSLSLTKKEKSLLKTSKGEIPHEEFLSLVKKLASQ